MSEYQSYDLIVAGGGSAGCIIASRIAENGMNPITGDRLRVALIEGGPYLLTGKEPLRPGYGVPSRRRAIANISYLGFSVQPWPYDGHQNKMVGGCGLHWNGSAYLPLSADYDHWQRETGVDWSKAKFKIATDEIVKSHNLHPAVLGNMVLGNNIFRDAARAMGYEPTLVEMARTNCINSGYCGAGHLCKYDAKGGSLYYICLAEENGVEIIFDSEVEQVIIEKRGARAFAKGVYYTQYGKRKEARAPKVIVACGTAGTPVVLMRSGYGSKKVLGDRMVVENNNVGEHLDGDMSHGVEALFDIDIKEGRGGVERYQFMLPNSQGKIGEHTMQFLDTNMASVDGAYPHLLAMHKFAPELGWAHKKFMRTISRRLGAIAARVGAPTWEKGTVDLEGRYQYNRRNPMVLKSLREGTQLLIELYRKMDTPPVQIDTTLPTRYSLGHQMSSCRAGESPENSVVNSDFECHDIENLFLSSAAVIPRGALSHAHMPTCITAAYAWRRIVENHFSRGV